MDDFLSSNRFDRRILDNYAYLCLDGSKLALTSRPCEWAHKPTNVFVTDPNRQAKKLAYLNTLQTLFYRYVPYKPSWWHMKSLFSHPLNVTQLLPVPLELQQWDKYLGNFISSIEKPLPHCESNNITICASSLNEEAKCLDLQKAAFSLRIRPEIDCKRRSSKLECLTLIAKHQADLTTLDLASLHEIPHNLAQSLEPIGITQQAFVDYAVAVVRADSGIRFLYDLSSRRSCHGSYGDLAAWWAPQTVLSERSLLDQTSCNKAEQMADYFAGSCVPGAADLRVNQYKSGSDRLCALCKGDQFGLHQCERSSSERYYGNSGALRCLVEGTGEVAFMSMTSLASNVDGRSQELWAKNVPLALDSRNFRLICRSGPSMLLGDYERCHLTRLPGKIIVSNRFNSREDRLIKRLFLTQLEEKFIRDSSQNSMFELFGSYQNESDLLFDDFTNRIIAQRLDMSTFEIITKQHFDPSYQLLPFIGNNKNAQESCKLTLATGQASSIRPNSIINISNIYILHWLIDFSLVGIPTIIITIIINSMA